MTEPPCSSRDKLLLALQRGVPLTARPFAELGRALGLTGEAVREALRELLASGLARRFGGVFDSRRLGYASTLCAVDVPDDDLERAAAVLAPHPGVTHCYEREGHPNLWFTLTAPADALKAELAAFAGQLAPCRVLDLPALRRFKVEVVLNASADEGAAAREAVEPEADEGVPAGGAWPEREKAVVRALQDNLPLVDDPFGAVADALAWNPAELLALLSAWRAHGVLRRVAVILRHREAGFTANGMCVWCVPPADIERAGRALAARPEVTHCYHRPPWEGFRFNLFAMIHAREREAARRVFEQLSRDAGLTDGTMLVSVREFKKSSPVFFCEGGPGAK